MRAGTPIRFDVTSGDVNHGFGLYDPHGHDKPIHGGLLGLGVDLSSSSVWNILGAAGVDPAPRRAGPGWREFLRQQASAIIECDFFTVDTIWLRRV